MNIFAGLIQLDKKAENLESIDLDILDLGKNNYFVMGAFENAQNIEDVEKELGTIFPGIISADLSVEWEDRLEVISNEFEEGVYEQAVFMGPHTSFEDILERFADSPEVICVREVGNSPEFENKVIAVDFVY